MTEFRHVKGMKELFAFLDTFPDKFQKNVVRGGLRAGMRVVQDAARANVSSKTGKLRRSLKLRTNTKGGIVYAYVRTKLYYAGWQEYGTAAHRIIADGRTLTINGRAVGRSVMHPGQPAKPYLRPALDESAGAAVVAMGNYIKSRLNKAGLNTPDVDIEEV